MASVHIDRTLNRKLKINRFLSFPQFAELMVQHRLQLDASEEPVTSGNGQRWRTGPTGMLSAHTPALVSDPHTIQIVSDVGALADSLFADAHTELYLEPSLGVTSRSAGGSDSGVNLVVKSFGGDTIENDADAPPTVPVLVDIARLLKGVSVASTAPAHFADLIAKMVRDQVWIDIALYPARDADERDEREEEDLESLHMQDDLHDHDRVSRPHARTSVTAAPLRPWRASRRFAAAQGSRRKIAAPR